MTALFNRWLPGLTLAIWGFVLLHFAKPYGGALQWLSTKLPLFTGRVDDFLALAYRPWVLPAGLLLLGMAVIFFIFPADAACCRAADCSHPLSRFTLGKWLTFLVLVVPVTVSAKYTPGGFSKQAMMNRGIATDFTDAAPMMNMVRERHEALAARSPAPAATPAPAPETATASTDTPTDDPLAPPLPGSEPSAPPVQPGAQPETATLESYVQKTPEGYLEAEVLDLLYAAQDNTLRKVYDGRTVQLIGQLMPDPNDAKDGAEHRFKAVRMFMTCCAADARPVATIVEAKELPNLPEMTWIKIVGKATFPIENGRRNALLQAEKVEKTEPPSDSMLY